MATRARGTEENQEAGDPVQGASQDVPRLTPEKIQSNQHEGVTNTHHEIGAEGEQRTLPPILRLPLVLIVVMPTRRFFVGLVAVFPGS